MPPTNTPAEAGTPADRSRPDSPVSFRSALRELASPVLDYASTLTIQAEEDDIDADNVSFLRAPFLAREEEPAEAPAHREARDPSPRRRLLLQERALLQARREGRGDALAESQISLLRARRIWHPLLEATRHEQATSEVGTGRRRHEIGSERLGQLDGATSPYGDRVPNQQSLYDWAPATDESEDEELEALLLEFRRQQPFTHPEILRVLARADLEASREQRNRGPSTRPSSGGQPEPSLRSAAILQSVRRNWRFSTRSRVLMSRYMMERERAAQNGDYVPDRESSLPNGPNPHHANNLRDERATDRQVQSTLLEGERRQISNMARRDPGRETATTEGLQRHYRAPPSNWVGNPNMARRDSPPVADTIEALQQRYRESSSNKLSDFEQTIQYLHMHRTVPRGSLDRPPANGPDISGGRLQMSKTYLDPLLEMDYLRPSPTSWLTAGTTFTGHQQANPLTTSSTTLYRLTNNQPIPSTTFEPANSRLSNLDQTQPWLAHHLTSTPLSLHSPLATPGTPSSRPSGPAPDRWTVKVAIHDVDYDKMTLQGTMEAFNVPSVPAYNSQYQYFNAPTSSRPTTITTNNSDSNQPNSSSQNAPESNQIPSTSKTTFSTYLEGEIIDFAHHTLLTEPDHFAVRTTSSVDALYWRRLEPFAKLTDAEIARALLDQKWVREQLMSRFILMRWKERCFVKPTFTSFSNSGRSSSGGTATTNTHPNGLAPTSPPTQQQQHERAAGEQTHHRRPSIPQQSTTTSFLSGVDGNGYGLSISGFYYISLRRSDGRCEGLYYDPHSSPYQHLELKPTEGTWGSAAWEFR